MAAPAVLLAALLIAFVALPLLRAPSDTSESPRRAELEAMKEAKYREIKDAELDYRMGKTSEADWRSLDAELRAQAIEILKRLDSL